MSVARDASRIQVEKDGYETLNLELDKSFRAVPTILGNIIWLIPGLAVDFIAGGAWDVRPVDVTLDQEGDTDVLRIDLAPEYSGEPRPSVLETISERSPPDGSP